VGVENAVQVLLFHVTMVGRPTVVLDGLQDVVRGGPQVIEGRQGSPRICIVRTSVITPLSIFVVLLVRARGMRHQVNAQVSGWLVELGVPS